jgi:ribonuclease HII
VHSLKNVAGHCSLSELKKAAAECSAFSVEPSFDIERMLLARGYELIAGVDEAGRGALAGPLCVGLVIYRRRRILSSHGMKGINDSKKLSVKQRAAAFDLISVRCLAASSVFVSHRIIDRVNINGATRLALKRLLECVYVKPDIVLMDGNFAFEAPVPVLSIPQGDVKSLSIASASIIAKVRRDGILDRLDERFPEYGFKTNKGYGTRRHIQAIYDFGFSPLHRMTYEPVKSLLSGSLFT